MSFRIIGLDPGPFAPLHALSDEALVARGARRCTVTAKPGFPDRVELRDLEIGETALLLNYMHQDAADALPGEPRHLRRRTIDTTLRGR